MLEKFSAMSGGMSGGAEMVGVALQRTPDRIALVEAV